LRTGTLSAPNDRRTIVGAGGGLAAEEVKSGDVARRDTQAVALVPISAFASQFTFFDTDG